MAGGHHLTVPSRACPVCAARRARSVWSESGETYVRCGTCGCVFSDVSRERYEQGRHNAWDESEVAETTALFYGPARGLAHARVLDTLRQAARPAGGRLLDVGCGLGVFVAAAQAGGWDAHGIDASPQWVAEAQSRTAAGTVRQAAPEELDDAGERFDVVTLWDVIEHVHDPVPFLAACARLLRPGGVLFVRTPNVAYLLPTYRVRRRLGDSTVELGPLNHVVYFDAATMRRALGRAGLAQPAFVVFPPPQVALGGPRLERGLRTRAAVTAKNGFAAAADALTRATRGRVVLGADLDVFARRVG